MSIEEESIKFLENHLETSFVELMGRFALDKIEWLEYPALRPIGFVLNADGSRSNIICLFPPFVPNKEIKS